MWSAAELRAFIDNTYLHDANTLATLFPGYYSLGAGHENLLAFGAFDLDAGGTNRLFNAGRYTDGASHPVVPTQITEYVKYSWYTPASGNQHPSQERIGQLLGPIKPDDR